MAAHFPTYFLAFFETKCLFKIFYGTFGSDMLCSISFDSSDRHSVYDRSGGSAYCGNSLRTSLMSQNRVCLWVSALSYVVVPVWELCPLMALSLAALSNPIAFDLLQTADWKKIPVEGSPRKFKSRPIYIGSSTGKKEQAARPQLAFIAIESLLLVPISLYQLHSQLRLPKQNCLSVLGVFPWDICNFVRFRYIMLLGRFLL